MDLKETLAKEWRTVRELRHLRIRFDPSLCVGLWQCYEVCPVGCWTPHYDQGVVEFHGSDCCVACGACVLQCKANAIELTTVGTRG